MDGEPERCNGFLQDSHPSQAGRTREFRRLRPRRAGSFRIERALRPWLPGLLRPGWRHSDFVDRRDKESASQGHRESEGSLEGVRTCLSERCLKELKITSLGCLRSSPILGEPRTISIPPWETLRKCFLRLSAMWHRCARWHALPGMRA